MTTVAVAMITRDSLGVLESCLESIRPYVDDICVYDTGSSDGTVAYLESLGQSPARELANVRVERGEWRDDFAWARERSFGLVPASTDWVMWLDDDDVVVGAEGLRDLLSSTQPSADGLLVLYEYAANEHGTTVLQLWRERIVRQDRGFRWDGTVHEWLRLPDGRAPELAVVTPERLRVVHMRPASRDKNDRNLRLLKGAVDESTEAPTSATLAYLAAEYMAREQYDQAVPLLEEYLARHDSANADERAQAFHRLARSRLLMGDADGAVETELEALTERPDWGESACGLTEAYATLGRWEKVEEWARKTLELGAPRSAVPVNPLEFSFVPMMHLAEACFRTGRVSEGKEWLERAWKIR